MDNELRIGARALHRLTKRVALAPEEAVYVHRAKSPATIEREKAIASKARRVAREKDDKRREAIRPDGKEITEPPDKKPRSRNPVSLKLSMDCSIRASFRSCHACPVGDANWQSGPFCGE